MELSGVVGAVSAPFDGGFAADYDGVITLTWIGEIRAATPADCE